MGGGFMKSIRKNLNQLFFVITMFMFIANLSVDANPMKDLHNPLEFDVKSFYGNYKVDQKKPGIPSPSLDDPVLEKWKSPPKTKVKYRVAVIFPHLKDPFWLAVNYGVVYEARRLGVGIDLQHPGGYRNLGKQALQIEKVLTDGKHDGLIIGAVQFKKDKLEKLYKRFHDKNIPIVSVVNDSYTPTINAKAIVSWRDLGYQAGKFLVEHSKDRYIKIAVFPGPKGTGWAPDSHDGFMQALHDFDALYRIDMLPPIWGDTGDKAQRHLVNFLLKQTTEIDYLVGNALAAAATVTNGKDGSVAPLKRYRERHPNLKIISTYIIQDVYDFIKQGLILASPTDLMKDQGVMAVDMMVRILQGENPGKFSERFPFRSGPIVPIITQENIKNWSYERLFGPRGFEAVWHLEPEVTP